MFSNLGDIRVQLGQDNLFKNLVGSRFYIVKKIKIKCNENLFLNNLELENDFRLSKQIRVIYYVIIIIKGLNENLSLLTMGLLCIYAGTVHH